MKGEMIIYKFKEEKRGLHTRIGGVICGPTRTSSTQTLRLHHDCNAKRLGRHLTGCDGAKYLYNHRMPSDI